MYKFKYTYIIMNKKLLLLSTFLLASNIFASEEDDNIKINGEIEYGVKAEFGVDGLHKPLRALPAILKLTLPGTYTDYEEVPKGSSSSNNTNSNNNNTNNNTSSVVKPKTTYIPQIGADKRDLLLAIRYLSKNIKISKNLSLKLSEDYFGLTVGADIQGKRSTYETAVENKEIDSVKLTLKSDNKYLNGQLEYNVIGEQKEDVGIDKIDRTNDLKNKSVRYNFTLNATPDYMFSPGVEFKGLNRKYEIGPSLSFKTNGFYTKAEVLFNNGKPDISLKDELEKVKSVAPGYNKIEYFKSWTLKEGDIDLSSKDTYVNEHADLVKAEVSGYKGTKRILGLPSGSLYGDSLIRYAAKNGIDEVMRNPNTTKLAEAIDGMDKITFWNGLATLLKLNSNLGNIKNEAANNTGPIATYLASNIFELLGVSPDEKYAVNGVWSEIPEEFRNILPGYSKNFSLKDLDFGKLSPDNLYFNGLTWYEVNESLKKFNAPSTQEEGDYKKVEGFHYLEKDINEYVIKNLKSNYTIIDKLVNGAGILELAPELPKIGGYSDLLKNIPETKGIDMVRGVYFHQSEKERNELGFYKELKPILKEIDEKERESIKTSPRFELNLGYINNNNFINTRFNLNDRIHLKAKDNSYDYKKMSNGIDLTTQASYNGLFINGAYALNYSNVDFNKTDGTKFKYDDLELDTYTHLGYIFRPNNRWDIEVSFKHLGSYGYIYPKEIKIKGNDKKFKVAIRDSDNNPLGKDKAIIEVNKTTEFELVNKEYTYLGEKKYKRDIHQSDYILTEETESKDSIYKNINIFAPLFMVKYRPYENIEIKSGLETDVNLVNKEPSGFRFRYDAGLKYILNQKDFNIFKQKEKLFNPLFNVNLALGADVHGGRGVYFDYDISADINALRLDLRGSNISPEYLVALNPLVVDFKLKPRLSLLGDLDDRKLGVGLEVSNEDSFYSLFGYENVFSYSKDRFEKSLDANILKILEYRKDGRLENVKNKLNELKFIDNFEHTPTPFMITKKSKGAFRYDIRANAIVGSYEDNKESNEETEFNFNRKEVFDGSEASVTWQYLTSAQRDKNTLEFAKVKEYREISNTRSIYELNKKKYHADIKLVYDEGKGIEFINDTKINFEKLNYREEKYSRNKKESINSIYAVNGVRTSYWPGWAQFKWADLIDQFSKDKVIEKKSSLEEFRTYMDNYLVVHNVRALENTYKDKIYNAIDNNPVTVSDVENRKVNTLGSSEVTLNNNIYLGYNFKIKNKFLVGAGLDYKLYVNYLSIDNIIVDDIKMFGSSKLEINNELSPTVKFKYDILGGLKVAADVQYKFKFEGREYKGYKFGTKLGLEYTW